MEDKREMTRDELELRLSIEEGLRKAYQTKYEKLEKLEKEREELKTRLNTVYGTGLFDGALKCRKLEEENDALKGTLEAKNEEIERLRKKNDDQCAHLNSVQQALLNRNMKIEALNNEVDRLKKEVKERRVVFEPTSYLIDIQAKDEEIKALRKKNMDLKNENEGWKLKYDYLANERLEQLSKRIQIPNTITTEKQNPGYSTPPIHVENLNVTYYANGPVWTNEEDE